MAACDYTLIGEEFFAASAYLSGEPDQLGTLQAQDSGKVALLAFIVLGSAAATVVALAPSIEGMQRLVELLQKAMGG